MADNTGKSRKRNRKSLQQIINWLIKNRPFLAIVLFGASLLLSCFYKTAGYFLAVFLILVYLYSINKQKGISNFERFLILFLIFLLLIGPYNFIKGAKRWDIVLEDVVKKITKIKIGDYLLLEKGESIDIDKTREELAKDQAIIKISKEAENIIKDGNFIIPLSLSIWGHGFYSDIMRAKNPNVDFVLINFLNANISIAVEKTEKGNALKITNRSGRIDNKVGIVEQYIEVQPGLYKFSFLAKAENLDSKSVQFSTTRDWLADAEHGGYELETEGSFDWRYYEKDIKIEQAGKITFTIVSKGKGTVYLTNLSLIKIQ